MTVISDTEVRLRSRIRLQQRVLPWVPLPHQLPPTDKEWLYWLLMTGRGAGKTDAGSRWVDSLARTNPRCRIAIVAPTLGDARETCVYGETGLLAANPSIRYHISRGVLDWPNGSQARLFGAYTPEDVERLRGPQHHFAWLEEFASWPKLEGCWNNLRLGLRLGVQPRVLITTTPKLRKLLKRLIADSHTRLIRATTDDNPYLSPEVRAELERLYGGTRLGRQELKGELVEDVEGALWTWDMIEGCRLSDVPRRPAEDGVDGVPNFLRAVVAVDPAVTSGPESDETGIVGAATAVCNCKGELEKHAFILQDLSCRLSPDGWARRAVNAYHDMPYDRVVAEVNQGGDLVERLLGTVDRHVSYKAVHATRGKRVRAEPVAALFEQGKVHLVGRFDFLEEQMTGWVPDSSDNSPDRVDAMVWAITELMLEDKGRPGVRWI